MTDQEKFEAFKRRVVDEIETQYGSELREKYSVEEVDRAQNCILSLTESEYNDWQALGEEICAKLEDAVSAKADPQAKKGGRLPSCTAAGCRTAGRHTRPRSIAAWRSSIRQTRASPPIMTGNVPGAPHSCGTRCARI